MRAGEFHRLYAVDSWNFIEVTRASKFILNQATESTSVMQRQSFVLRWKSKPLDGNSLASMRLPLEQHDIARNQSFYSLPNYNMCTTPSSMFQICFLSNGYVNNHFFFYAWTLWFCAICIIRVSFFSKLQHIFVKYFLFSFFCHVVFNIYLFL